MANNVTREEHLEALANAIKDYADSKLATIGGGSAATINNFTGASASAAGLSGLVPAPQAGDNEKFLRGDGQWVNISSGNGIVTLGTTSSTVEGAIWLLD